MIRALACALVAASVAIGCGAAKDSLVVANVNGCIQRQCGTSGDPADRESCEAACRKTYGK